MNACAFIYEQLRMIQMFGGCTANIQELDVPEAVFYGIERLLRYKLRDENIESTVKLAPPFGYVKSPHPFPAECRSVSEKKKIVLKRGEKGDRPKSLGPLARRMINDYERADERRVRNLETGATDPTGTDVAEFTETQKAVTPSKKIKTVSILNTRQKRQKVDMGEDIVPFVKKPVTRNSSVKNVGFGGNHDN